MPQTLRDSLRVCHVTPLGTQDASSFCDLFRPPFLTLSAGVKAWDPGQGREWQGGPG